MNKVFLLSEINELKKIDKTNSLAVSSLLETLIKKNIIKREEFNEKAKDGTFIL